MNFPNSHQQLIVKRFHQTLAILAALLLTSVGCDKKKAEIHRTSSESVHPESTPESRQAARLAVLALEKQQVKQEQEDREERIKKYTQACQDADRNSKRVPYYMFTTYSGGRKMRYGTFHYRLLDTGLMELTIPGSKNVRVISQPYSVQQQWGESRNDRDVPLTDILEGK